MFIPRMYSVFAVTLLFSYAVADDRKCYFPSGMLPGNGGTDFAPCNSNTSAVSMCCVIINGDRCTPEGICLSGSNAYYRDMCTDQTWGAPECINMCTDIDNPQLTRCGDGSFCCGANNSTCCDSNMGSVLPKTRSGTQAFSIATSFSSTGSSTSTPASTTGSSVTSTTTSSIPAATSSSGVVQAVSKSSTGNGTNVVAIAAGVGCSVGVLLVALALAFFFWRRSANKKKKAIAAVAAGANSDPANDQKRGFLSPSTTSASPTYTGYGGSGIEDGSVMSRLATSSPATHSPQNQINRPPPYFDDNRIHEMDQSPRNRFHELPGENGIEMAGNDRRLGSPYSVEKY